MSFIFTWTKRKVYLPVPTHEYCASFTSLSMYVLSFFATQKWLT
jgi:hypothetical protein